MNLNTIIYLSVGLVIVLAASFLLASYFISRTRKLPAFAEKTEDQAENANNNLLQTKKYLGDHPAKSGTKIKQESGRNADSAKVNVSESNTTNRMTRINSLTNPIDKKSK